MISTLGIGGSRRNACAAICVDGEIRAACEQERLTRVRGIGLEAGGFPKEAVDEVLALAHRGPDEVTSYVVAERDVQLPSSLRAVTVDHHRAHAAAAFLTSPFHRAAVLICDSHPDRELSVWIGDGSRLDDVQWPWQGRAFATLYSECSTLFGFPGNGHGHAHRLEALAHLGSGACADRLRPLLRYSKGRLEIAPGWPSQLEELIRREQAQQKPSVETASAVQQRIGEMLLELVGEVRATVDADAICLGGGLFYNTYFTTLIRTSGLFRDVFVPINPGNAGLAVGGALLLDGRHRDPAADKPTVSPFLGPEFDAEAIKAALDGCKLSYEFVSESQILDATVDALSRGQLVGWFQGRMEWGPRVLGHRSILANPCSPYVLDNLNFFLRKREKWRAFGVSVSEDQAGNHFCGPPSSRLMEYEYRLRDDRLRPIMPAGASSIRVQTVVPDNELFWMLHMRMRQATGTGVLVNTSFNGFHEPIVCGPRDAIRVFYGTGLDMLVLGRFILRK
jgi:carbamoyltransferase